MLIFFRQKKIPFMALELSAVVKIGILWTKTWQWLSLSTIFQFLIKYLLLFMSSLGLLV